jgi:hypothetical protein
MLVRCTQQIRKPEAQIMEAGRGREGVAVAGESALRREHGKAAQPSVVMSQTERMCNRVSDKSRKRQPGNLLLRQRTGRPAQQQQRGADRRNVGERLTKRKFPRQARGRLADVLAYRLQDAAEGTVDGSASSGD